MKKTKKNNQNNVFSKLYISFRNGFSIILIALGIESFLFKTPYNVVLGMMLILVGILVFPNLDLILNRFGIKLTVMQKWFIGVSNFLTATYSIRPNTTEFYRCIISFLIMMLFWVITIIYSKNKSERKVKKYD